MINISEDLYHKNSESSTKAMLLAHVYSIFRAETPCDDLWLKIDLQARERVRIFLSKADVLFIVCHAGSA